MTKVLIPVADGSEEMETVILVDVLRRAGANVVLASVMPGRREITASRRVALVADELIDECVDEHWDLIALPGGMPGAKHLAESPQLKQLLLAQAREERWLAAICAAPAVVLGPLGLLQSRRATGHPNFRSQLSESAAEALDLNVVRDGKLLTSQGPGTAMAFALALVECLFSPQLANELRQAMVSES